MFQNKINSIADFRYYDFFSNTIGQIIIALLVFFLLLILTKILLNFLKGKNQKIKRSKNFGDLLLEILYKIPKYFFIAIKIYIPLKILTLHSIADKVIDILFGIIIIIQTTKILNQILNFTLKKTLNKGKSAKTTKHALQFIIQIIVWVIGGLLLLSNLGIEITPLIASLGLSSIAVAFALQNILSDLFSSLSILLSKPFDIGDRVVLGDKSGSVTNITLKATHIQALSGQEIIIPNSEVLGSSIDNYGKMKTRRKRFTIGVIYETPPATLEKIPKIIKGVFKNKKDIKYEWTHLTQLGDFSINFEISYVLNNPDYDIYVEEHHKILLNIIKEFEKNKIDFAYPTQVIYTKK